MVDRHLLAILSIAGVMSTGLVSLLFHESVNLPVQILRDDWNLPSDGGALIVPAQEGRYAYTLAIVVRRPVVELVLSFALLENRSLPRNASDWETPLIATLSEVGDVGGYLQTMIDRSQAGEMRIGRYEVPISIGAKLYTVDVFDFSESVLALAPHGEVRALACVHAFVLDERRRLLKHFAGGPDFFIAREEAVVDLTIQRNENVTKYAQRASDATGTVSMDSAPPYGRLVFRELTKDDRISITIAFNPAQVPGTAALMQVVSVKVDGVLQNGVVHLLRRSSGG